MATVTSSKRHLLLTSDTYTSNGDVVVGGDLTVSGSTTTLDTQNLIVEDKNIIIGQVSTPSDTTADGGGITLKGGSDYTIVWNDARNSWLFNQHLQPSVDLGYDLGGTSYKWRSIYAQAGAFSSLTIGGNTVVTRTGVGNTGRLPVFSSNDNLVTSRIFQSSTGTYIHDSDNTTPLQITSNGGTTFVKFVGLQVTNNSYIEVPPGTEAIPAINFGRRHSVNANDTNTGIYSSAGDHVDISTGGTRRIGWDSTGTTLYTLGALGSAASVFLTSDSGVIKTRSAAQVRSDIGAAAIGDPPASHNHDTRYLRKDVETEGTQLNLGGEISASSSAKLQVQGFMRTGPIMLAAGNTGTSTFGTSNEKWLMNNAGSLYIGDGTSYDNKIFHDSYHPNADKWTTARTITLGGDLSGSVSIDGSANVTLSGQVADDSHFHHRLDSTDDRDVKPSATGIVSGVQAIRPFFTTFNGMTGNQGGSYLDMIALDTYSDSSAGGPNAITFHKGQNTGDPKMYIWKGAWNGSTWGTGQRVFADNYHPNADAWTTGRTITLSGDLNGSVTLDGSANVTLSAQVVNNSHTHDDRYVLKAGGTFEGDITVEGVLQADDGFSSDGNNSFHSWRALQNTASSSNQYYRIARISGGQSSRFIIELAGRSSSYSDGTLPAFGKIVGQFNNDNNYDIVYYNASATDEVVDEVGQVDVSTSATDIYVRVGQFSELTATGHISDGSITPFDSNNGSTSAPTGYVQATEYKLWNTGNDGSGSGLDADLLDGVQGSSYLRSDATDTFTNLVGGTLEFDKLVYDWTAGSVAPIIELKGATSYGIFYHEGSPDAMKFSTSGNTNYELAFSSSGITHKGNTIWHAGNDGALSGLDADKLDGQHGTYYRGGAGLGQNINYVASSTSTSNRGNHGQGVWAYSGYSSGSNRPFTYDATLQVMPTTSLGFELSTGWHSSDEGKLKIRALRDCCEGWGTYHDVWTSANFSQTTIDEWNTASNNHITGIAVTGTSTKTITLTQNDGGTISANFTDNSGSAAEADTLATVTGRGASTTTSCTFNTITMNTPVVGSSNKIKFANNDFIRFDDANGVGRFHFDCDGSTNNASLQAATFVGALSGNASTASSAAKWTTARTLTLNGDVSGSVSWDGSGNATLTTVVANNSHQHSKLYEESTISYGGSYLQWMDQSGSGGTGQNGSTPGNPFSDWFHHLIMNHGNSNGYYVDIAACFHSDDIYFRRNVSGSLSSWREFIHTGNIGSQSVSNADTVDSLHASDFLRSNADDGVSAGVTYTWAATDTQGLVFENSSYNKKLYIGGWTTSNSAGISRIRNSNDNLHIDAGRDGHLYLNHYCTGNVYIRGNIAWHAGNDGSGTGLDADKVDGFEATRFFRRTGKTSANVGPGWMTVAENTSNRQAGEIIVTDGDSGDHSYIRIEWMRSYADSHYTVLNTGGHSNRITGVRVLKDGDQTYGNKKLQVYVTVASTYEVNVYEQGDIDDFGSHTAVTPVIQNSILGYSTQGSTYENLDTYAFSVDQGVQGQNIRSAGNVDGTNFRDKDNTSYSLTPSSGTTGYWQVNTPSGNVQIGAQNTSYAHFQTDRARFYFNKEVQVDGGVIRSHNEDLQLGRAGTSDKIQIRTTTIGFFLDGAEDMRLENDGDLHVERDVIAYSSTISDERLKDNVLTIDGALDKVCKLRGVEYTWNKGSRKDQRDIGVIAQEVEEVIPEVVREKKMPLLDESEELYKTVDYEKLTAVLIEAVKELKAEVADLKQQINEK